MSEFDNDNILTINTVQIAPFRTLMTALKDILIETNISFQKDVMRIINMDKSHTILAHLHLKAENFEYFHCGVEKIIIGVNMLFGKLWLQAFFSSFFRREKIKNICRPNTSNLPSILSGIDNSA